MTSPAESGTAWFAFLDERLRTAVGEAARDDSADDALRGLYISDEHALELAAGSSTGDPDKLLSAAADRLALDALDSAVLGVCAGPELHPRYGRLYAYLQDDVTRRLASPRLVADLLCGDGVARVDVLACFGTGAPLQRLGAIELLAGETTTALPDRLVKVANRLSAFLLGAGGGLAETGAVVPLRRVPAPSAAVGRPAVVDEVARLLATDTHVPLMVCGPDAAQLVAAATGRRLVLLDARELTRPEPLRDATLACALEGSLLCVDALADLTPVQRVHLLRAIEGRAQRTILLGRSRTDALACSDLTVMLVDVPLPTYGERRAAWEQLTGARETRDVAAKFRLSIEQIREAAEVSRITARARGGDVPLAADLDAGARHASSSRLGELATRLAPAYAWDDLVLPDRQHTLLRSISAYLRHRDRVLSDWGYERTVSRTQSATAAARRKRTSVLAG